MVPTKEKGKIKMSLILGLLGIAIVFGCFYFMCDYWTNRPYIVFLDYVIMALFIPFIILGIFLVAC